MSDENTLNNVEYANLQLTAQIVSAWTANNSARPEELLETIHAVHKALSELHNGGLNIKAEEVPAVEAPKPVVPIKKSVNDNQITCLCCGKSFKSIKRHIGTSHGLLRMNTVPTSLFRTITPWSHQDTQKNAQRSRLN